MIRAAATRDSNVSLRGIAATGSTNFGQQANKAVFRLYTYTNELLQGITSDSSSTFTEENPCIVLDHLTSQVQPINNRSLPTRRNSPEQQEFSIFVRATV
jgi:hypothetical protein